MENEAAEQAWQFWRCDLSDAHGNVDLNGMSAPTSADHMSRQQRLEILNAYTNYHDALSCADSCSVGVLGVELDEILDPTLPEMPAAAKDDFTIARSLLEADPLQVHFCSRYPIFSTLSGLALENLKRSASSILSPAVLQNPETSTEEQTTTILEDTSERDNRKLTRYDVAVAFDPIAVSPKAAASLNLDPSVFDRTMTMIVVEVAPWVRGIVHYEEQLMQDRQRLNELLSDGGSTRKRRRTTRSAYSALEGGERRTTRREQYFGDVLSTEAVMYTAGKHWQQALPQGEKWAEMEDDIASSPMSASAVDDVSKAAWR
ncbi:ATPase, AAA-type, core [Cordyceps fumosorosea ARSEF 2679]|uniref:ATPase, AAA-type, core n=1 Tax=Cordyceps fumosorosea (strain ARSEF 2679) TaxID=1081104 RepID=A0A167Q5E2_CORFA|nr:ATPase, AAA-type, core [Cordyceps fumosorosea ARSEF 2679]OAA57308.1 ATPase, AAA-type, core [Cordyceps fumosorosea ARSEF 2679]